MSTTMIMMKMLMKTAKNAKGITTSSQMVGESIRLTYLKMDLLISLGFMEAAHSVARTCLRVNATWPLLSALPGAIL